MDGLVIGTWKVGRVVDATTGWWVFLVQPMGNVRLSGREEFVKVAMFLPPESDFFVSPQLLSDCADWECCCCWEDEARTLIISFLKRSNPFCISFPRNVSRLCMRPMIAGSRSSTYAFVDLTTDTSWEVVVWRSCISRSIGLEPPFPCPATWEALIWIDEEKISRVADAPPFGISFWAIAEASCNSEEVWASSWTSSRIGKEPHVPFNGGVAPMTELYHASVTFRSMSLLSSFPASTREDKILSSAFVKSPLTLAASRGKSGSSDISATWLASAVFPFELRSTISSFHCCLGSTNAGLSPVSNLDFFGFNYHRWFLLTTGTLSGQIIEYGPADGFGWRIFNHFLQPTFSPRYFMVNSWEIMLDFACLVNSS